MTNRNIFIYKEIKDLSTKNNPKINLHKNCPISIQGEKLNVFKNILPMLS